MTTELENEVREAMLARASILPSGVGARCAMDYRPRRRRAPAAAGVLVGAATAGTVVAVVVGGGAPAAYAGWSATPTSAPAPSPQAAARCQSQLTSGKAGPQGGQLGSGAWQNVLTDVRGPFTVALFQDDGAYAACFTSSSFTQVNQISTNGAGLSTGSMSVNGSSAGSGAGQGLTRVGVSQTSSGDLQNVVQTHLTTTADGPYTLVEGRAASGVTGVSLVEQDGQDVVATVADGWFVAWWPATEEATSAQVSTASGTTTEQLKSVAMPSPPSVGSPSSGGPVSGSGSGSSGNSGNSGNSGSASGDAGTSGLGTSASAGAGG